MERNIKLIAFDLDGVLVDGGGSWIQVHKALGTFEESRKNSIEYFEGKISFAEWAKRDVSLWKGTPIQKIEEILLNCELMPGIDETLTKLNKKYRLIIISGGLKLLADHLKEKYNLYASFGNELIIKEGKVAGVKHIVDFNDKGTILEKVAYRCGYETRQCAAIGDYLNDIPMFNVAGFSIAFNPKNEEVCKAADEVIYEKDLRKLLKYF